MPDITADLHDSEKYIAAIDLGSNSFHMVITRESEDGVITVIDKVREMVRLGAGLDDNGDLDLDTQERALACLVRFRQRLESIPDHRIQAVGTNTFRAAKNSTEFLARAEQALGYPISIISGHEEARLVYLGAAFDLSVADKQRLVIDIGGGSTEMTIGRGFKPFLMDSLYMGCVSMTRRIFGDGLITAARLRQAENIVRHELETVLEEYRATGWDEVVGTSGTIKAIDNLARDLGVKHDWISVDSVDAVENWVLGAGNSEVLDLVSSQRRPVFIGGFVILSTIFRDLGLRRMDISQGALKEGVAYELAGRLHNKDSRFTGVNSLVNQFQPDRNQIERVENLSIRFLDRVKESWGLTSELDRNLLVWASQLHELGMSVSYSHHNQHTAYIVENAEIDGFSRQIQRLLAAILRYSRQKMDNTPNEWLSETLAQKVMRLTILLRMAIAFYRGRTDVDLEGVDINARNQTITVTASREWADMHPLTLFDLESEAAYFSTVGIEMKIEIGQAGSG